MEVYDKIKEAIADIIGAIDDEKYSGDSQLTELGIDSLDMIEILIKLEEEFGMEILNESADKWKTIKDIVEYINEHI